MVRDLENITAARSIKGEKIPHDTKQYLENFAKVSRLLRVEIGSDSDFSKPFQFFSQKPEKFQYLVDGKIVPFCNLNGRAFIAFNVKRRALCIYGYFPGETV